MDHSEASELNPDGSKATRACDSCRTRKIRCDRAAPCSNCVASKLVCHTTIQSNKPPRQRVHISDEYEKKIDRIEERLSGIETVLDALLSKLDNLDMNSRNGSPPKHSQGGPSPLPHDAKEPEIIFEGSTALNSHSEFARNVLERAVVNTPSMNMNPELKDALTNLQNIVNRQNMPTSFESRVLLNPAAFDNSTTPLERPPWEIVEAVLTQAIENPTLTFHLIFPFLQRTNFRKMYMAVFQSGNEAPHPWVVIVHALLYNLFQEFGLSPPKGIPKRSDYLNYLPYCRRELDNSIGQFSLYIPANYDNILALLLASTHAIEISRPSLSWILVSTAANLSLSIGYHRYASMKDDTAEDKYAKIHIFWFIYIMDKSLSLRLGRPSMIQDWDISLPDTFFELSPCASFSAGIGLQRYWIELARLQGQTYEQLFSPAAFKKPEVERCRRATDLISALNQAFNSRSIVMPEIRSRYGELADIFHYADVVIHYSLLTLMQRALGPDDGTFSPECVESARAALVAHHECSSKFNILGNEAIWTGYLHWSILQTPFTPFIVIFCNTISSALPSDLEVLHSFTSSLQPCRTLSEGADKLYKLCNMFFQVAKLYVEAKEKENQRNNHLYPGDDAQFYDADPNALDMSTLEQFDPYLTALGFAPNSTWPMGQVPLNGNGLGGAAGTGEIEGVDNVMGNTASVGFPAVGFENANPLQNWFSGSRYIMGLMEEDMTMF